MKLFRLLSLICVLAISNLANAQVQCVSPTFDGYTYDVVEIDGMCWFAENLRTTVLRDGTPITLITDNNGTDTTIIEASRNNPTGLYRAVLPDTLDGLAFYNSHTYYGYGVQQMGDEVCPTGFRMPTYNDLAHLWNTFPTGEDLASTPQWNDGIIRRDIDHDNLIHGYLTSTSEYINTQILPHPIPTYVGNNSSGFNAIPTGIINSNFGGSMNQWPLGGTDITDWQLRTEIVTDGTTPTGEPLEVELKRIDWFVELQHTHAKMNTLQGPGIELWQEGPKHKGVTPLSAFWINYTDGNGWPMFSMMWGTNSGIGKAGVSGPTTNKYVPIRCMFDMSEVIPGCTDVLACNYNPEANLDDESCVYPQDGYDCECNQVCYGDFNFDGGIGAADFLIFLGTYGMSCEELFPGE